MSKVILVLIDGLGFEESTATAGVLEHLVEYRQAAKYRIQGEMPPVSRPMYETVMTGLPVSEHGVFTNNCVRPSECENLFSLTRKAGRVTAAAAYSWMSELYQHKDGPYDPLLGRYQLDSDGDIQYGIFYHADEYPDAYLYFDGDYLRRTYHPDFLLFHPMGCDYAGHRFGKGSREYRGAAVGTYDAIASLLPAWRRDGYDVVVTADHGMDELGVHAGNTPAQREIALYIVSDQVEKGDFTEQPISQLQVAPLCCFLLGLNPGARMRPLNLKGGVKSE